MVFHASEFVINGKNSVISCFEKFVAIQLGFHPWSLRSKES